MSLYDRQRSSVVTLKGQGAPDHISRTPGQEVAQIEAELQIPGSKQIIGLDRGCTEIVSSDRVKLKSKGVTNGSFIGLKYPGFTRADKVSEPCQHPASALSPNRCA